MSHQARGLFLDLDGTLAQSLGVLEKVYRRFLEEHGREGSAAEFNRLNGPPLADVVASLKHAHKLRKPVNDLLARYWTLVHEAYDTVQPSEGAAALVAAARADNWKIAVVTSNSREVAGAWLEKANLARDMAAVVTADMVAAGKPEPDIYLKALELTACAAGASYAIEDSLLGAQSAVAAGLRTFALVTPGTRGADWPQGVDAIGHLGDVIPRLR